jgi:hypothetical protein
MRFVQKRIEIAKRPEHWIHIAIIRDVVAKVRHRRPQHLEHGIANFPDCANSSRVAEVESYADNIDE